MSRLARAVRDLVDVDVERARSGGMQLHLEGRLLARLANRRRLERDVVGLDVAAGLQKAAELRVLDETGAHARLVDHEGRRGEVRGRLVARHRLGELVGESKHRAAIRLLGRIGGDMRLQQPHEHLTLDIIRTAAPRARSDARRVSPGRWRQAGRR